MEWSVHSRSTRDGLDSILWTRYLSNIGGRQSWHYLLNEYLTNIDRRYFDFVWLNEAFTNHRQETVLTSTRDWNLFHTSTGNLIDSIFWIDIFSKHWQERVLAVILSSNILQTPTGDSLDSSFETQLFCNRQATVSAVFLPTEISIIKHQQEIVLMLFLWSRQVPNVDMKQSWHCFFSGRFTKHRQETV